MPAASRSFCQTHRTVRDTNPIIDLSAEKEKDTVMDEVIVAHTRQAAHLLAAACETWRPSTFSFPLRRSREREVREDPWHVRSSPACARCCPRFCLSWATMRCAWCLFFCDGLTGAFARRCPGSARATMAAGVVLH